MVQLDEKHRYTVDGITVPGFTEICKDLGVIKDNPFYTDDGRDNGTGLHKWCLFLAQGNEPAEDPDSRIAGRFRAFGRFLAESGFAFVGGEEPAYHSGLMFCCTPDLHGGLGGVHVVIDIKGGAKQKWHPLQTAAQKLALADNGIKVFGRYSLYLDEDRYKLEAHTDPSDEQRWRALVTAYHAKNYYSGG